ncbi:Type II secretion system protein F [Maioricimonas rarisocia]|uniref:Type II secretion system protein F n=1 Tax=Maioricimonas rarisocia TaxID=2528026 RepID=A0A517ZBV4_9PLAN|nr:type II secretion system F family protein [Maioricimonas rarisocia]QDU39974.1 Type II secretion system protein F [Maioricimonas rarisocia]
MAEAHSLTATDLAQLNDELAAAVRAGIPLDLGLHGAAQRAPARLRKLTAQLSDDIARGKSLVEALEAHKASIPPVYRAIIEAGTVSGRLDEALADVSQDAAATDNIRAELRRSLIYPCVVAALAYGLFVLLLNLFVPHLLHTYEMFRFGDPGWLRFLARARETLGVWGPLVPLVAAGLLLVLLWATRRGGAILGQPAARWIPGYATAVRDARVARFCHLLAMLIEHDVPMPQSVRLAADATGDRRLIKTARTIADRIEAGGQIEAADANRSLPPFVLWMLQSADRNRSLALSLRQAADTYRQRAVYRCNLLQKVLPSLLVVAIAGSATILYALAVFGPMSALWYQMGME